MILQIGAKKCILQSRTFSEVLDANIVYIVYASIIGESLNHTAIYLNDRRPVRQLPSRIANPQVSVLPKKLRRIKLFCCGSLAIIAEGPDLRARPRHCFTSLSI